MQFVADLHLHSKYSRAVSQNMVLPTMASWAKKKGIDILTTGDWTHPLWFREIKTQLEEAGDGIYKLKSQNSNNKSQKEPLFLLSTEIASIYSQGGKLRRIHNLVFAPNLEIAEKINKELHTRGCNLMSDGRPIIGFSSRNLLELILGIDKRAMLVPCHAWTPHFGIYGSASGFDSLGEAFGDLEKHVYAIETGLSSDPEMNWQISELKTRSILSFSDAHSPAKMGREATVFELETPSYENMRKAIMRIDDRKSNQPSTVYYLPSNRIVYTLEFYPEEGKYHYSGHRNCGVVRDPEQLRKEGDICPVCKRRLTEGVLYRVQQLADDALLDRMEKKMSPRGIQWYIDRRKNHPPYVKLVPLLEVVAESLESTVLSQKAKTLYENLCETFGSEINVLLKTPIEEIEKEFGAKVAEGVRRVRLGTIAIAPGYDGEYGKVKIWPDETQNANLPSARVQGEGKTQSKGEEKEQMGLF